MHHQFLSISRGGNSILEKLRDAGINPEDYIAFYSLRTWDKIKSDTVYHTKSKVKTPAQGSTDDGSDIANNVTEAPNGKANGLSRSNSKKGKQHRKSRSVGSMSTRKSEDMVGEEMVRSATQSSTSSAELNDGRMDFVTDMVYIHSKLLIVDDRIVVCGSGE